MVKLESFSEICLVIQRFLQIALPVALIIYQLLNIGVLSLTVEAGKDLSDWVF
jgi:hypothetical protein